MPNFNSFAAVSAHVSRIQSGMHGAIHDGIVLASDEILDETHTVIGNYHPAAGPYAPWASLAASTKASRARRGYSADEPELLTGKLRDSYHAHVEGGVGSADPVALVRKTGKFVHNLPARPILGIAFVRREKRAFKAFLRPIERLLKS